MKQLSSMMVGLACSGSSTPPMPTPPDRCTFLPICAQRADGGPGVDHRAFVDIGADVDVAGHQHHVLARGSCRAAPPPAARRARRLARIAASSRCENLVCTLSKKARSPACIGWLSLRRKLSSTAFLTHWLTRPLADALALGDAHAAGVEVGDHLLDGLAHLGRAGGGDAGAAFPGEVDDGLQFVHVMALMGVEALG